MQALALTVYAFVIRKKEIKGVTYDLRLPLSC